MQSLTYKAFCAAQARKEARRAEENRRREAELLEARKAYFEERRTAEAKKYSSIHNSSIAGSNPGLCHCVRTDIGVC